MSQEPPPSPVVWEDGAPRSRRHGDVYFSAEGGLEESRAVFLRGCGLPEAWAGRRRFVVGELGFGTGLNICALLRLWREQGPADGRLHVFTVEAHPLSQAEARLALAAFPEVAPEAQALTAAWPGRARGFHRCDLPSWRATVDVAVMEAGEALGAWRGVADAWFLDGFAPALNPDMWREDLMALVAARTAPGGVAATYTVAGAVRRGLAAAGFAVDKRPGFGRKRERLEARMPGEASESPAPRVAIVGAGIAGASLARAFRAAGMNAEVFEAEAPGAGASGNAAALVSPGLDAGLGPPARLQAAAFRRAARLYGEEGGAVIARGVLRLETAPRDVGRFDKIAAADLFEADALRRLDPATVAARLGEPAPGALDFEDGLVVEPATVLAAWMGDVRRERISTLSREGGAWRLRDAQGAILAEAEVVCLAAGADLGALLADFAPEPVRGAASVADLAAPGAASFGGYVAPTRQGGVLFGAVHDRGDAGLEDRPDDLTRNLTLVAKGLPRLAASLASYTACTRVSIRATTPDRRPWAGAVPGRPGLFVLGGLGSRGFTTAPLLAEHVAALALGAPSPLEADLAVLVDPARVSGAISP